MDYHLKRIIENRLPKDGKYYHRYKQEWRTFNKEEDGIKWYWFFPEDMRTWATDNNITMRVERINNKYQVEFDTKHDAMLFRLRWGGE
jgi:hypothetical protein